MKIKEQTRKLAAGCSKHSFEVADKTDEVSSKHCFEVVDRTDEVSNHIYGKATLTWFEEIFEEYYFSLLARFETVHPTDSNLTNISYRQLSFLNYTKLLSLV